MNRREDIGEFITFMIYKYIMLKIKYNNANFLENKKNNNREKLFT